jgi:hypothetical protein
MARRSPQSLREPTACAFDDPVPSGSTLAPVPAATHHEPPHRLEKDVQRRLAQLPGTQILALTVRRIENGVCLEGTLETDRPCPDIQQILREISGVEEVINRLRVRQVDRLETAVSPDDETVWM